MNVISSHERPVILCVDDDAQLLETIEFLLAKHFTRHRIVACINAEDAISQLRLCADRGLEVQLVLTDQMMDELTGIELLAEVPPLFRDAIRIILTGQAGLQSAIDAIKLGIDDYLEKPVTELDLVKTLRNHLDTYALRQENRRLHELVRQSQLRASEITELAFRNFNLHLGRLLTHDGDRREIAEAIRKSRDRIFLLSQLHRVNQSLLEGQSRSRFRVSELVADALGVLRNHYGRDRIEEASLKVDVVEVGGPLELSGQRSPMRTVLERIVENAGDHSPAGGTITVMIRGSSSLPGRAHASTPPLAPPLQDALERGDVLISVHNQGEPTAEDLEQLRHAQAWRQPGSSERRALKGLGLIISQEYLLLMAGQQWVEAGAGCSGVTVHLAFPSEDTP